VCLSCGCDEPRRIRQEIAVADAAALRPDERVLIAAEDTLAVAETWIGWNGCAVMSLGNAWTPAKALRRIEDHLIDHLCQIETRATGAASVGDPWRGRSITLDADWARFTEADLDEASARLRRLAQVMALRLRALEPRWDDHAGDEWTIRSIAEHVADAMRVYASRPAATALVPPPA